MASTNNIPILAAEMLTYLGQQQGVRIQGAVVAAYLTRNTVTGVPVSVEDLRLDIVPFIRESIPGIPIVSIGGYMLTGAWEPNRRQALWRIRTVITVERRLDFGHLQSLLREHERQVQAGQSLTITQQEAWLVRQASIGLQRGQQDMSALEQQFAASMRP